MSFYQRQGELPRKRHIAFRRGDGRLHCEELISRDGFSGTYSNLYHLAMPTRVREAGAFRSWRAEAAEGGHGARHIRSFALPRAGDFVSGRRLLFFNEDVLIHKVHPVVGQEEFYRNGHFDELVYVQAGKGRLETQYGSLEFLPGDYLVIPRGVICRLAFAEEGAGMPSLLVVESASAIQTPRRYRNAFGQLQEHSPYCERDIRVPRLQSPREEQGEFPVRVRLRHGWQELVYDRHPFDVVGWDGTHYPWAFSIHDFEPIVGRVHQPPTVHQTFEAAGFVVCSFVSRPFDFHPEAIPAPYPHSNVDSDEVLFYSSGEFMSRKGIHEESLTYHPMGLAHGPQPGRYDGSIGQKETTELAVMIDTFRPLAISAEGLAVEDREYALSWVRDG
ncbi:MAG: homogentisate 1,2-dioxygenase [Oligoflexia bacterium]|nr:homogentisate 1,2-dioxygenase [Oligoflexia bacterium]